MDHRVSLDSLVDTSMVLAQPIFQCSSCFLESEYISITIGDIIIGTYTLFVKRDRLLLEKTLRMLLGRLNCSVRFAIDTIIRNGLNYFCIFV